MKALRRLVVLLLLAALVAPMLIKGPDGEPLMHWRDWLPETPSTIGAGSRQQFYKWKDVDGNWVYSDEAPPAGVQSTEVDVDTSANIVQSTKAATNPSKDNGKQSKSILPGSMSETLQAAAGAGEALEKRQQALESVDR